MNGNDTVIGEWRSLGGAPVSRGDNDADVVFAHVSDLHGQLTPRHQVYYDNPTSGPVFDFGEDDRVIKRAGGVPILAAKLDGFHEDHDVCTLMSGDTFHGSAVTAYTRGRAMLDPINDHLAPDVYVPGNWDYSNEAAEVGVPYHLGDTARERGVEYEYEPLSDGAVIEVGDVEIEALYTPGHTSEMMNYLVDGELLLTGDTLFVDSVGRTELQFGEDDASRGAELLYDSLHETILELPDDTTILPGHLTVTSDGRYENGSPGDPLEARLGDLREELDFLGLDRDAFVERLTEDVPEKPPNYETVIAINTGKETVDDENEATELELGPNNCAA